MTLTTVGICLTRCLFHGKAVAIGATVRLLPEGFVMTDPSATLVRSDYAPVNGLEMYYEIHGEAVSGGVPLLLLHGSIGSLEMFRELLPAFTEDRQVIAVDQQAHGRTADIDRPLRYGQLAADAAAFLRWLGVAPVDVFGLSMGSGAALQLARTHPDLVRKLVVAGAGYSAAGTYPEALAGREATFSPEAFAGTPFEADYRRIAPGPDDFPSLVLKVQDLLLTSIDWSEAAVRAIAAPTMIVVGDSDIVSVEHAATFFRLRGGGVPGDFLPMPPAQLAVLPGTTHLGLMTHAEWLGSMVPAFLDAPMPEGA
jgi:pimeloyl-ACP methyl ester carboxylesterase